MTGHFKLYCCFAIFFLTATAAFAAPCALNPTNPSVTICTPTANSTVSNPVSLVAGSTDSAGAIAMAIYVDNVLIQKVNGNQISATGSFSAGQHYLVAQLWDNAGRIIKQAENFTVGNANPPPTISFSANPPSITAGQSSSLTWSTSNATSVTIDNGLGSQPTSGSVTVSPSATTTYTLTATGPGGTSTARATVTVGTSGTCSPGSPAPSVTICSPTNGATVTNPVHVVAVPNSNNGVIGMAVYFDNTLVYKANVNQVDQMINTTSGSHFVVVQFWDNNGNVPAKASENITVSTSVPPPTINFSANPTTIVSGQSSSLNWTTTNATSVTIDNGIGSVATSGTVTVSPTATTTYTLTATGPGGTATSTTTVTVTTTPPPTATISATPSTISSGGSSTLTWSTTNATSVSIDNGIGTVATSGTVTVSPTATTTYTLTATGPGGTATSKATVTVSTTPPPTATISANPSTISSGGSSTLTWSTTNAASVTIDNGIGSVAASGSRVVSPTQSTTYTLTATGPGGTTTASATVSLASTTCSPSSTVPSVNICSPSNGSTVPSPVHVVAVPNSNNGVIAMAVYFDNTLVYKANVKSVDTMINTSTGSHFVVVQFWDNSGRVPAKASVNINVSNAPPPPTLSITPKIATIYPNAVQQFSATQNGSAATVNWFVDGIQGGSSSVGSISTSGLYTAPGSVGAQQITAVSIADSSITAGAVLNVVDPNQSMITYHNDGARTGANTQEVILRPSNVNATRFGKIASYSVDGQIYAQPLYVPNLVFQGTPRNIVFVATEHDSVYAFDADGKTSAPYWNVSLLASGQSPVQSSDGLGISPEIGITSTPVIDRTNNVMYVLAYVSTAGGDQFWLHALDLLSGAERSGSPKRVDASMSGTGADSVNGRIQLEGGCWQRAGLALGNGNIYIAFGHCGHGWVLAYDTSLAQTAVYNTTPNGAGGTIWMGGGAPAFDSSNNVFLLTGTNFGSTAASGFNNSFMKFTSSLSLLDYFTPSNNATLVANDVDLGAGAVVVLPDNSSAHPHEIVGAGKDGRIFLLDRDNLGKFDPNANHVIQAIQSGTTQFDNFYDTPAYWNGNLYYHGNADVLRQFKWTNGLLSTSPTSTGGVVFNAHGATPVVSANGTSNGIVWELKLDGQPNNPAILYAYDAGNVTTQLYNSSAKSTDTAPPAVKFTAPTVVNGKVYVGGGKQIAIYGLIN